jgi:hypothetical protein
MALALMFFFLGLAKVAEPLYRLKLPGALRQLRGWELEGAVYRNLAVPAFGRCLRNTPLRYLNATLYLPRRRPDATAVLRQVESAEAIHFWAAVLLLPYMVFCALRGQWAAVAGFVLVQVLINVYPVMHLRLVRVRLDAALRRAIGRRGVTTMTQRREVATATSHQPGGSS